MWRSQLHRWSKNGVTMCNTFMLIYGLMGGGGNSHNCIHSTPCQPLYHVIPLHWLPWDFLQTNTCHSECPHTHWSDSKEWVWGLFLNHAPHAGTVVSWSASLKFVLMLQTHLLGVPSKPVILLEMSSIYVVVLSVGLFLPFEDFISVLMYPG